MSFCKDRLQTAKKVHNCDLCGRDILTGSKYIYRLHVAFRIFTVWKMHIECEKATEDWDSMDWEDVDQLEFAKRLEETA